MSPFDQAWSLLLKDEEGEERKKGKAIPEEMWDKINPKTGMPYKFIPRPPFRPMNTPMDRHFRRPKKEAIDAANRVTEQESSEGVKLDPDDPNWNKGKKHTDFTASSDKAFVSAWDILKQIAYP